jgi:hypothetical protein
LFIVPAADVAEVSDSVPGASAELSALFSAAAWLPGTGPVPAAEVFPAAEVLATGAEPPPSDIPAMTPAAASTTAAVSPMVQCSARRRSRA